MKNTNQPKHNKWQNDGTKLIVFMTACTANPTKLGTNTSNDFEEERTGTGTNEWSESTYNICKGCSHNCLYCYARWMAERFNRVNSASEWGIERVDENKVNKSNRLFKGVVMFPSSHEITPNILPAALKTLRNMLQAGNKVLIVSKPHLEVIQALCRELAGFKDQIQFRFTIGTLNETTAKFWEPGAPTPKERIEALKHAFQLGFRTSVSMEPMLDDVDGMIRLLNTVAPFVTGTIWLGKMNEINRRVDQTRPGVRAAVEKIELQQSDANILRLHAILQTNPQVRWKDSIKAVAIKVGINIV